MALEFFASCLAGSEALLAKELKTLGITRVRPLNGGVAFFGEAEDGYRTCLWSRLASRILLVIARVDAPDADGLYEGIRGVAWEDVLAPGATFAVRAHGTNAQLRNTRFIALKAKDALVDRMRDQDRERPVVDAANPRASVDLRLHDQKATVSLDFSGAALHHRGYLFPDSRENASFDCAVAAAALASAGWSKESHGSWALVDPLCDQGILLIEAVSVLCDQAPGLLRDRWGFTGWAQFDETAWSALVTAAKERFQAGLEALGAACGSVKDVQSPNRFIGLSTSSPAIALARKHVRRAGLRSLISIEIGDSQAAGPAVVRARASQGGMSASGDRRAIPCCVAANLAADRRHDAAALLRADEASFLEACKVAAQPEECLFIAIDGPDLVLRFPEDAHRGFTFGRERAQAVVDLFSAAPQESPVIQIIDLESGQSRDLEVYDATASQFAARLRKVFKERRRQAAREGVSCFRIYDADLPEYAVAIDWYSGAGSAKGNAYLSIAEYAAPASVDADRARRRFADVLAIAPVVCGLRPDHVFSKRRERAKGGAQYRSDQGRSYVTTVEESGHLFEVDLARRLDTGLFLDHRLTRQLVGDEAQGRDFLNLFAYTGSASVYAAAGGARSTTTVDLSQPYIDWAKRNMENNRFTGDAHRFCKADVLQWITQERRSKRRYDLIFVDPPTFSNSKAMGKKTWDVQRDHAELLIGVVHLLRPEGEAIFSCNLRSFKPDTEKLARYGVAIEDISEQTIPFDFLRTPNIHRCYRVWRRK